MRNLALSDSEKLNTGRSENGTITKTDTRKRH